MNVALLRSLFGLHFAVGIIYTVISAGGIFFCGRLRWPRFPEQSQLSKLAITESGYSQCQLNLNAEGVFTALCRDNWLITVSLLLRVPQRAHACSTKNLGLFVSSEPMDYNTQN